MGKGKTEQSLGPEINVTDIKVLGEKPLGEGCFGQVWKGEVFATPIAVKIPHNQGENLSVEELEELRKECKIMKDHQHENICMFMGACTQPGKFRIVTELLDGDLEHLVHNPKCALTLFERLQLAQDAARGLLWLHKTEPPIIHRDLKPANMLIKKKDGAGGYRVKVTDFGLSSMKSKAKKLRDGKDGAKGTPLYMAPEVMMMAPFDEKADVYSFAISLWEIVTGKDPFAHHDDYEVFTRSVMAGERPPIPKTTMVELRDLLVKMWDADPHQRPTMLFVVDELNRLMVKAAIPSDPVARKFWRKYFLDGSQLETQPNLRDILMRLCEFLSADPRAVDRAFKGSGATSLYEDATGVVGSGASGGVDMGSDERFSLLFRQVFCADHSKDARVSMQAFGHLLHWYGPIAREKGAWSKVLSDMCGHEWFFGDLSAAEADRVLKYNVTPGGFLVRYSSTPGSYTIVRKKEDNSIGNIRVNREESGGFEVFNRRYADIAALVEQEREALFLTSPAPGSPFLDFCKKTNKVTYS